MSQHLNSVHCCKSSCWTPLSYTVIIVNTMNDCWWPGEARSQGFNIHFMDIFLFECCGSAPEKANIWNKKTSKPQFGFNVNYHRQCVIVWNHVKLKTDFVFKWRITFLFPQHHQIDVLSIGSTLVVIISYTRNNPLGSFKFGNFHNWSVSDLDNECQNNFNLSHWNRQIWYCSFESVYIEIKMQFIGKANHFTAITLLRTVKSVV